MSFFKFNQIFASILIVLIVFNLSDMMVDYIFPPTRLSDNNNAIVITKTTSDDNIDITGIIKNANAENGRLIFKKCAQCHNIVKNDSHKIGPNLWNVFNNKLASKEDYMYSKSFYEKQNLIWDVKTLNDYLYAPQRYIRGTKMSFYGLKDNNERADIISYIALQRDFKSGIIN